MLDSDDETTSSHTFLNSYVLIALDSDPSMFTKPENSHLTYLQICLSACYELSDSLIFTKSQRKWSPFGVILSNSDTSISLVNFQDNILDSIKLLKEKKSYNNEQLIDLYQRKANFDLSAFFLNCKKKFKEIHGKCYKRTIIFITNNDEPVNDKQQRFTAINGAKDLQANGIDLELVTLNINFNYSKFYNELLSVLKPDFIETIVEDVEGLLEKLSSLIITKYYQRKLAFYPFLNDKTRFLRIIQKALIRDEKFYKNGHVTCDGKKVKKLIRDRKNFSEKTFTIKKSKQYLRFSEIDYLEIMSNDCEIGYTLLHVSNRVTPPGLILRDNVLIECDPNEDLTHLDQFWQFCVDNQKVMICVKKLRSIDRLRFVEFVPVFANNSRKFMVKLIPFQKEMRRLPSCRVVDDDLSYDSVKIGVVESLIDKLSVDYYPKMFSNPVNAKKKAFLRAKLLDEEKDSVKDVTLDCDAIDKCLGDVGEKFTDLIGEVDVAMKRKSSARGGRGKRGRM